MHLLSEALLPSTLQHFPLWEQRKRHREAGDMSMLGFYHMSWKEFLICVVFNVRKKVGENLVSPSLVVLQSGHSFMSCSLHSYWSALSKMLSFPSAKRQQFTTIRPGSGCWSRAQEEAYSPECWGLSSGDWERGSGHTQENQDWNLFIQGLFWD